MSHSFFCSKSFGRLLLVALIAASLGALHQGASTPEKLAERTESLSAQEFSRLVEELSEEEGYFRSDNFTSNESSYLQVVEKLRELHPTGDAYLGVGPEQNFTYIAKIRPRIAFIVDIRRQAMIQHLMFKALFHMAENRTRFLSLLLSRPLPEEDPLAEGAPIDGVLRHFAGAPPSEKIFETNLGKILGMIKGEFLLALSEEDVAGLTYVYSTFRSEGLAISTRAGRSNWGSRYPTLRDLLAQRDSKGIRGSFMATEEDYGIVRGLHLKNRIIPVVGDFGGRKALSSVGAYLREHGYKVTAFYTSNVEQYLFQNSSFGAFAENVKKLPIDENSVFIRAVLRMSRTHPAYSSDHRTITLLQKISQFNSGFDQGLFPDYWNLVTTDFIAGHP